MTTQATNPVYDRINKLLALANNPAATEAEAALAAEHVQRLLQDHNLTLSQVEATGAAAPETQTRTRANHRGAMYQWQRDLMGALADNNFCLHYVREARVWGSGKHLALTEDGSYKRYTLEKQHVLVGRDINVRVTLDTYDYLVGAITRAAGAAGYDTKKLTRAISWFRAGAVARLTERLAEVRRRREAEDAARQSQDPPVGNGTHRELVLSDVYGSEADLNNDFLNNYPAGTTAARRRSNMARHVARLAERDRMIAEGVEPTEAWYRACGYEPARAAELAAHYNRPRRGGRRRAGTRWTQSNEEYYRKVNSDEYAAGKAAGGEIGLDTQVGSAPRPALPRE